MKRKITRTTTHEETLDILPCPFCGGEIEAGDCGYTTFNPGYAKCLGKCKREWVLSYVADAWGAGVLWNKLQSKAVRIEALKNELKKLENE